MKIHNQKDPKMSKTLTQAEISKAYQTYKAAVQQDHELAWGWHCNVAVASQDEGMNHEASNKAAARFMFNAFGTRVKDYEPRILKEKSKPRAEKRKV